jgi:hypothetical protein
MPRIYTVISKAAIDFPEWMPNLVFDDSLSYGIARAILLRRSVAEPVF